MLSDFLWIGSLGAVGALARYLCSWAGRAIVPGASFPWATLLINVMGCLLIGALMTFVERQTPVARQVLLGGVVGFLGSFTTFSAFGFETLTLLQKGETGLAALYVGASVGLGLAAVALGRWLLLH